MYSEAVVADVSRTSCLLFILHVKADSQRAELLCEKSLGSIYTKISFVLALMEKNIVMYS